MQKFKQAFTLVELIVVIIILSILGTIAFISLQGYSKSSRDSVRISDVSNMKTSLELFHLNSGKYPLPDNGVEISYSGEILRTQGFFGENVISQLSRNLSKIPTDPLTDKQYIYSVANNRNEFEILALLEADLALNTIPKTNAATLIVTPRVDGNYNGIFLKTPKYVVPIPSIINSEVDGLNLILDNTNIKSQITTGGENIPNYGNINYKTGALTGLELSVAPSINSESTDTEKLAVITAIQNAYTGSILNSDYAINNILSKTSDEDKLEFVEYVILKTGDALTQQQSPVINSNGNDEFTKLLLHTNTDANSVHTVTTNGNTKLIDTAKFGQAAYFDGNGDSLNILNSEDWDFGSGNATVDLWVNFEDLNVYRQIIGNWGTNSRIIYFDPTNGLSIQLSDDTDIIQGSTSGWLTNTWYHIAMVKNGSVLSLYRDGISLTSGTLSNTLGASGSEIRIGRGESFYHKGFIDEVRITKGEALWSSDFSGNLPTLPSTETTNTKLLLHMDGTEGSTTFTDSTGLHSVTPNGDVNITGLPDSFGNAMYFDGDGDYLSISDSEDWNFGSEDFTIDFFTKFNITQNYFISRYDIPKTWGLMWHSGGGIGLNIYDNVDILDFYQGNTNGWESGKWYHIALVRNSDNWNIYRDGISIASTTSSVSFPEMNSSIFIGSAYGLSNFTNGYIDEFRISKGKARWTEDFVPPSVPYGN